MRRVDPSTIRISCSSIRPGTPPHHEVLTHESHLAEASLLVARASRDVSAGVLPGPVSSSRCRLGAHTDSGSSLGTWDKPDPDSRRRLSSLHSPPEVPSRGLSRAVREAWRG